MAKMIYAEYRISSIWNLDEVCADNDIDPANVVDYYIKWDTLYLTYKDADGEEQKIEIEPNYFSASEGFDWKRPDEVNEVEEDL